MENDNVFMVKIMQQAPSGYTFRDVCELADETIAEHIEIHNFKYKQVFVTFKIGEISISKHFKSEYRRDGAMVYGSFMCFKEFDILNRDLFGVNYFEVILTEEKLNNQNKSIVSFTEKELLNEISRRFDFYKAQP